MEPIVFGIIKGEQPLIRASRASKVAGAFLVLFWHAKENISGGEEFYKSDIAFPTRERSVWEVPFSMSLQFSSFFIRLI